MDGEIGSWGEHTPFDIAKLAEKLSQIGINKLQDINSNIFYCKNSSCIVYCISMLSCCLPVSPRQRGIITFPAGKNEGQEKPGARAQRIS